MSARIRVGGPRTFESFPENAVCPVCGTNHDGETVLVPIRGTERDNLVECQPVHLTCSIMQEWVSEKNAGIVVGKGGTSHG